MCRGVTRPNVMTQGECIARAGAYILIDDTKKSARPAEPSSMPVEHPDVFRCVHAIRGAHAQ